MPVHNREVWKPRRIDVSTRLARLQRVSAARKTFLEEKLPARIRQAPAKTALIPYVVRILSDRSKGIELTPLQKRIISPVLRAGLDSKIIRRFGQFPEAARTAISGDYFKLSSGKALDDHLLDTLKTAAQEVKASPAGYTLKGGFKDFTVFGSGVQSILDSFGPVGPPPPSPKYYHFQLTYRGLQVHNGGDRFGTGVDPYFAAGFCRKAAGSVVAETIRDVEIYKHEPHDLGEDDAGTWHPVGGEQDANGNPPSPYYIFPKLSFSIGPIPPFPPQMILTGDDLTESTPLLCDADLYYSLISVWEMDGDSSAELRAELGAILVSVGSSLLAECPVAGAVVIVIGALLELSAFVTAAADDPVGDLMLVFGKTELEQQYLREIAARVSNSDSGLDWTLYFGVNSVQAA